MVAGQADPRLTAVGSASRVLGPDLGRPVRLAARFSTNLGEAVPGVEGRRLVVAVGVLEAYRAAGGDHEQLADQCRTDTRALRRRDHVELPDDRDAGAQVDVAGSDNLTVLLRDANVCR
jgi:hypothetical protein